MWTTIAHGHTKTLGTSNHNISAHLTGWFQQCETEYVCRHHRDGFFRVQGFDETSEVAYITLQCRILENGTEHRVIANGGWIADNHIKTETLRAGLDDINGLRETLVINKEGIGRCIATHALGQRHGFSCRGGFIQQ